MLKLIEVTHKPEYLPPNIKKKANAITARYSKWLEPKELLPMYDELEAIGVTVGAVHGGKETAEVYYNGVEVVNSKFVYSTYKDRNTDSSKIEFTIYLS